MLHPIKAPFCGVCGTPFDPLALSLGECAGCRDNRYHGAPPYLALRSAYYFEGPLRHAVHRFKYREKAALAAPLGLLMHQFLLSQTSAGIPVADLAAVVPVPLHGWRQYRRGYNQSELLARELADLLAVETIPLLRRIRHTPPQVQLSARQRTENLKGAFAVNEEALQRPDWQRPVLLVDDVCTTGSTIRECARTLTSRGIKAVYALTLARQM